MKVNFIGKILSSMYRNNSIFLNRYTNWKSLAFKNPFSWFPSSWLLSCYSHQILPLQLNFQISSFSCVKIRTCPFALDWCFIWKDESSQSYDTLLLGAWIKEGELSTWGNCPEDVLVWFQTKARILFIFLRVICFNKLYKCTELHVYIVN